MAELPRAAAVGAGFLLIFGAAEAWRWFAKPPPELSRKFVHFVGGLLVLAFPWIFTSRWTVLWLASCFALLIWGTRRLGLLQSVHSISRRSEGGLFYPLAVVLLFTLAYEQPVFYLVAALALVVSDTAAALLGSTYGRTTYSVESDRRSLEGSASFFVTTFLVVHVPLLLMTEVGRDASVLLGIHISLIVTLIEGVSLRGSDNLLVPLATYYMLVRFVPEPAGLVAGHLAALVAMILLLGLLCLRSKLMRTSGVMAAALFFYGVYVFGGGDWLVAPTIALAALAALRHFRRDRGPLPDAHYQVLATIYAVLVALVLLATHDVTARVLAGPDWLVGGEAFRAPFIGVIAGQLSLVSLTQFRPFGPGNREPTSLPFTLAVGVAAVLLVVPTGLWFGGGVTAASVATAAAIALAATAIYWTARTLPGWPAEPPWNMSLQTACSAAATLLVLPIHFRFLAGG